MIKIKFETNFDLKLLENKSIPLFSAILSVLLFAFLRVQLSKWFEHDFSGLHCLSPSVKWARTLGCQLKPPELYDDDPSVKALREVQCIYSA
jgi:hypothetical protein